MESAHPKGRSYWASDTELVGVVLRQATGATDWNRKTHTGFFRSRGWKEVQNANKALANYIDGGDARAWNRKEPNLIVSSLDPEAVLKIITASFIAAQSQQWLHKFYAYLSERASYQKFVKDKPIFLDQDGNAASAFDDNDQLILFLPDEDIDGYTTIKEELLSNKNTHEFVVSFGIKKPSIRDEIYNKILPEYKNDDEIDTTPHFKTFFRYFKECKHEEFDEFIKLISDKAFLEYTTASDETVYRGRASDIYLPFSDLKAWFETKPDTKFLLLDEYREVVDENDFERLDEFLRLLGISSKPRIVDSANDKKIDGLDELLSKIGSEYSEVIWKMLSESWTRYEGFLKVLKQHFGPRGGYKGSFWCESSASRDLRTKAWILNKSGVLCSAEELTVPMLSEKYDSTSALAESFIKFLGIRNESLDIPHLSEEEARKIRLVDEIEQSGLSDDEIRAAIEDAKRKKGTRRSTDNGEPNPSEGDGGIIDKTDVDASPVLDRINDRIRSPRPPSPMLSADIERERTTDSDYFSPAPVDYNKKIARAEERNANEIAKLEREEALQKKANQLPRYSYGWFLALLELECMASSENNADSKTIFISFGKVERDSQSTRTIVLREPSRFVPQSIEEFSGVRVDLDFGGGRMGKLRIESFTAKEFSLLGKLEAAAELNGIDLDEVLEARIEVQNPSFLLQELLERFRELKFAESFDMKANLTSDIEFIFGPPGTGKTTHLAEKLLIPLMQTAEQAKVLVLTPTNKAADVLTTRIMDKMGVDTSYLHWLVRFGTSADERIEKAGVRRDRSFDIDALERSVTVTTIARFAYDGFAVKYGSKKLFEMEWDAILIDEASMISIASIIYPLYRQNPRKFIIAGDPFQIEPIVAVEQWKDENIYTLVGLNKAGSFAKPVTQPHEYPVTNLEIQYRSIPAIGEIFSRFTYNGILKHHREAGLQRSLKLHGLNVQPLNLIKFPVSKYESIYRAKRLKSGTPYQTYSALFTFEFVRWLTAQMQIGHEERCRIGIIAPYRAQASLLSRLNDSWSAKPESVEIQVGTIHGFQGDECDIIVAVFNPPPNISSSSRMFLNKQNILNVAISRARDYLFIVMPDGETEDISKLDKIARLEELVKSGGDHIEYMSHEIEKVIWDQANYLEENTFSTGHQMVNVYRKPERYYEVRSDESAIDVQIHEND